MHWRPLCRVHHSTSQRLHTASSIHQCVCVFVRGACTGNSYWHLSLEAMIAMLSLSLAAKIENDVGCLGLFELLGILLQIQSSKQIVLGVLDMSARSENHGNGDFSES